MMIDYHNVSYDVLCYFHCYNCPYGLVRRRYTIVMAPRIWGALKSSLFAGIRHIWYKIVSKTQFKRESFGKSVPPIASFELPVRVALLGAKKVRHVSNCSLFMYT